MIHLTDAERVALLPWFDDFSRLLPLVQAIVTVRVEQAEQETLRRYALREISWDGEHPDGHQRDENDMADLCDYDVHAYKDEPWACWRPKGHDGMHIGGRGIQDDDPDEIVIQA